MKESAGIRVFVGSLGVSERYKSESATGFGSGENCPVAQLAEQLEGMLGKPVIDETGITYNLSWNLTYKNSASLLASLKESGVQVKPETRAIKILRVLKRAFAG